MAKTTKISVRGHDIKVILDEEKDYISLTDMAKGVGGVDHIRNWMRNKNTVEYLGLWETLHNPDFKGVEFDTLMKEAGLNRFNLTPQKWANTTNAIGIMSKPGKKGGTFAHKDIAFSFGRWISPAFELFLTKEFQRLKENEAKYLNKEWDYRRFLSKVNYQIHTDSIKQNILPRLNINKGFEWLVYAEEADLLNFALFETTAKKWREKYPDRVLIGRNMRDYATIHELTVLANLESYNAIMIKEGKPKKERLIKLRNLAISQLQSLSGSKSVIIGSTESPFSVEQNNSQDANLSDFDNSLKTALNHNPKGNKEG